MRHWHTARLFEWHVYSEAFNRISFLRFVPSVDSGTTVEGLRAFAKEISFLRFVPSVVSVTTVEGLRGFFKEIFFQISVTSGVRLWSTARLCEGQTYLFNCHFLS